MKPGMWTQYHQFTRPGVCPRTASPARRASVHPPAVRRPSFPLSFHPALIRHTPGEAGLLPATASGPEVPSRLQTQGLRLLSSQICQGEGVSATRVGGTSEDQVETVPARWEEADGRSSPFPRSPRGTAVPQGPTAGLPRAP